MRISLIGAALQKAVVQLGDPPVLAVLLLALVLMLLITGPFVGIFLAIAWLVEAITPASVHLPWVGDVGFLGVFTQGLVSRTSWIFWTYVMAPVAGGILGFFLDRIINAVEARHYPALAPVRARPFAQSVGYALRFFALMALVSLGALVVSFFSGMFAPAVFVVANGFLISREYFETVALRRVGETQVRALEARNRGTLMLLGVVLALAYTVPFISILVPVVGIAAFTHVFHALQSATR